MYQLLFAAALLLSASINFVYADQYENLDPHQTKQKVAMHEAQPSALKPQMPTIEQLSGEVALIDLKNPALGSLKSQLKYAYQLSQTRHEDIVVEITADWCSSCRIFKKNLDHPQIKFALDGVLLVMVDMVAWEKELQPLGLKPKGIPAFYQITQEGIATEQMIEWGTWGKDTPENMAKPLHKFISEVIKK